MIRRRADPLARALEHLCDQADGKTPDAFEIRDGDRVFAVAVLGSGPAHDEIVAALQGEPTHDEWRAAS
jgi:hypothetical protein